MAITLTHLRKALSLPPHQALRRGAALLLRGVQRWHERRRDGRRMTFLALADADLPALNRWLAPVPAACLARLDESALAAVCQHYLDHRFDLLGSGWVPVRHTIVADAPGRWLAGRVRAANLAEAQRRWGLIQQPYAPIDWHIDFKSGHRWPEACWYRDVRYGHRPGVDIKVPWELARGQHLPQLALAFTLAQSGRPGFAPAARYVAEVRNQVIDFAATNPPRFGVNWRCAMDVAIRAVNWLIARDLLLAHGAALDADFERLFCRSMVEHGAFIRANLEGAPSRRNNHYLADIVGLLFIAAYLPAVPEYDGWLRFAAQELVQQVHDQFLPDGGNFEASTSYHGLSAEMVTYAAALLVGLMRTQRLPPSTLPAWLPGRLRAIADFSHGVLHPDGTFPQIGDNDSGRLLKLAPRWEVATVAATRARFANLADYTALPDTAPYHRELAADPRPLTAALRRLVGPGLEPESIESAVIGSLARDQSLDSTPAVAVAPAAFPAFGLYIYDWDGARLLLRCGPVGQNGVGGHAHNDQLSFVLSIDGAPCIVDPGSYAYTPDAAQRNQYRGTARHNTLTLAGREQNDWHPGAAGLFSLARVARSAVLEASPHCWSAEHDGFGPPHCRTVRREPDEIVGTDHLDHPGPKQVRFHLAPAIRDVTLADNGMSWRLGQRRVELTSGTPGAAWSREAYLYSPAYGWAEAAVCLCLRTSTPVTTWRIRFYNDSGMGPGRASD